MNNSNSNSSIKYGAIISYIGIFLNIATGLIYTPWMLKQIGQSEYGLYALALSIISFFTIDFGLGEAVSRFLSKYNEEQNDAKKKDFLGVTFKIYIFIDFLLFILLSAVFIFANTIYAELTPAELSKFRVVFCIAALYSLASFPFMPLNGVLISNERFVFQKSADIVNRIMTVTTMVIVLILGYKLYSLVIVNAITGIITIGIKLKYIRDNNLMLINFKSKDKLLLKEIFRFSSWTTITAISSRLVLNITPTVLAAFAGSTQITLFSIAMVIEGYTWTFANALNGLFLPRVTRITIKQDNSKDLENLMIKVGRIQYVLVGLLITGLVTMGKEFMLLWMGQDFVDSYYVMLFLIAPCIVTLTQQIANTALVAVNEIKYRAISYLIVAFISIIFSLWLSQILGAIGSGIAIFTGNFVGLVIGMNLVYYKVLKINILRFFRECHMKMAIPLLLASGAGIFMQYFFPAENLFLFIIKACILGFIYLLFMWKMALNEYEKNLFSDMFYRINSVFRRKFDVYK